MFLAYVSPEGHALVGRALYLPKEWTGDRRRCRGAGVPEGTGFATTIALAKALVERAVAAGRPAGWVTADAVYGADYSFRHALENLGPGYVVGVRKDFALWSGDRRVRAKALLADVPATARYRLSCGAGSKGPRRYDWAAQRTMSPSRKSPPAGS